MNSGRDHRKPAVSSKPKKNAAAGYSPRRPLWFVLFC
jgi:hypothetical protein